MIKAQVQWKGPLENKIWFVDIINGPTFERFDMASKAEAERLADFINTNEVKAAA
jgi:hypothetical protein